MNGALGFRHKEGRENPCGGSVPRERPARWRRPLQLVHSTLDHAFRLADAGKRSADDAERVLLSGRLPNRAKDCLIRAWDQLAQAAHRANTSGQYLSNAFDLARVAPEEEAFIPALFTAATEDTADAIVYLSQVLAYVHAVADHFKAITVLRTGGGHLLPLQRARLPKHDRPPPDERFDHEQHVSSPPSTTAEGFRRVTRGRSPPRQRTAVLHAVSAAAERPVRLRHLS